MVAKTNRLTHVPEDESNLGRNQTQNAKICWTCNQDGQGNKDHKLYGRQRRWREERREPSGLWKSGSQREGRRCGECGAHQLICRSSMTKQGIGTRQNNIIVTDKIRGWWNVTILQFFHARWITREKEVRTRRFWEEKR